MLDLVVDLTKRHGQVDLYHAFEHLACLVIGIFEGDGGGRDVDYYDSVDQLLDLRGIISVGELEQG